MNPRMNANGLTYVQWLNAAGMKSANAQAWKAWDEGACPCDYRAQANR